MLYCSNNNLKKEITPLLGLCIQYAGSAWDELKLIRQANIGFQLLIEKLSVRKPGGEVKLEVLKEIAKEYQIEWDTSESELELLKVPEELLEGPRTFVSASSMPIRPHTFPQQHVQPKFPNLRDRGGSSMHIQRGMDSAAAEFADSNMTRSTVQRHDKYSIKRF